MTFKQLHNQETPLILGNVWDVPSLKVAEKLNFQAVGTSSAAIASLLGYNDGEEMKFSELEYMVQRIARNATLPLSVDIESGYSRDSRHITSHIKRLVDAGVAGINIEDSIVTNKRTLLDSEQFAKTLVEVKNELEKQNSSVFLNVRTDTFILLQENRIEETKKRIKHYEDAGADGVFVPCIENISDIKSIVNQTNLPVNVMCMPNLPNFELLTEIGVKRISMGNFLFDKMYTHFEDTTSHILKQSSFNSIF